MSPQPAKQNAPPQAMLLTDADRIPAYFRECLHQEVRTIASYSFLGKSANSYGKQWLIREIIQNFVDANKNNPGTLDGVRITKTLNETTQAVRYKIEGDWIYEKMSGLLNFLSEKGDADHAAGGNAIGLKQVTVRFIRDLDVSEFKVNGENWCVEFIPILAKDVNATLDSDAKKQFKLDGDWLGARITHNTGNTGKCSYEITTSNPDLIQALDQMCDIAVCKKNRFLQQPHFQNEHGSVTWLAPSANEKAPTVKGRLFMNGQVFAYGYSPATEQDPWPGPELLTLNLRKIKYDRSIDRPAISSWKLKEYSEKLVNSMSRQDLVDQIKISTPIWSNPKCFTSYQAPAAVELLGLMIERLDSAFRYKKEDLAKDFPELKLAWIDREVSAAECKTLQAKGHTLCPQSFAKIGAVPAKSLIGASEAHVLKQPDVAKAAEVIRDAAAKVGIFVSTTALIADSPEIGMHLIAQNLEGKILNIKQLNPTRIRICFNSSVNFSTALLEHPLREAKDENQKALHFIRSLVLSGISSKWIRNAALVANQTAVTFKSTYDSVAHENVLIALNNKVSNGPANACYLELDLAQEFIAGNGKLEAHAPVLPNIAPPTSSTDSASPMTEVKNRPFTPITLSQEQLPQDSFLERHGLLMVNSAIVLAGIAAIWFVYTRQAELFSSFLPQPKNEPNPIVSTVPKQQEQPAVTQKRPEPTELIKQLNQLPTTEQTQASTFTEYQRWRFRAKNSGAVAPSQSTTEQRTISEVILENNRAEIDNSDTQLEAPSELAKALEQALGQLTKQSHEIQDFKIVEQPTETEFKKLAIIRDYFEAITGVHVKTPLFLYEGKGAKGVNMNGESIGLHRSLLQTDLAEAFSTFAHEVAHNYALDHSSNWRAAVQALYMTAHRYLSSMGTRISLDETTPNDDLLRKLSVDWILSD
jgi:hypothetical protein